MKKKLFLVITLITCTVITFTAFKIYDDDSRLKIIVRKFNEYFQLYKLQKIYIHTDRDYYAAGEDIWFKAYLFNATNQLPETEITNIYVEIINEKQKIIHRRVLRAINGVAFGDIHLADTTTDGHYQLRAFTPLMRNFSTDYFFTKNLIIENQTRKKYSNILFRNARKINEEEIDLQFFPEGGELTLGLESKVAFKAINVYGKGIDIEGYIINQKKEKITEFKAMHNGMGFIVFTPKKNEKYKAVITKPENIKKKTELPEPKLQGYVLNIKQNEQLIDIKIQTNKPKTDDKYASTVILICQAGGQLYQTRQLVMENNSIQTSVPADSLPAGITQITIFNTRGEALAERLVFIKKENKTNVAINTDKTEYSKREKTNINIGLTGNNEANVSVSVALTNGYKTDNSNIWSAILLTSDLKGYIENPAWYFITNDPERTEKLDLVMLTHGWRKFTWPEILKEKIDTPQYKNESCLTVSGKITRPWLSIPCENANVTVTFLDKFNDTYPLKTNEKGIYKLDGVIEYDSVHILVEATTSADKKNVLVNIDLPDTAQINFNPLFLRNENFLSRKNIERLKYQEPKSNNDIGSLHSRADQVIVFDEKMSMTQSSVLDILRTRVPGLRFVGNGIQLRGPSSFFMNTEPLYLIDNVPVTFSALENISPTDVDRIEIIKDGSNSVIYGTKGANGVIAVYTKRGFNIIKGKATETILGYCKPRKFYEPKYTNAEAPVYVKTLYWNPQIKILKGKNAAIQFTTSDLEGEYEIIVQGISGNNELLYQSQKISIK